MEPVIEVTGLTKRYRGQAVMDGISFHVASTGCGSGRRRVFGLPVALVIGFGLIPGFSDPQKGLSDQIGTEYIAALGVAIVLASLGLTGVPMVLGQSGALAARFFRWEQA